MTSTIGEALTTLTLERTRTGVALITLNRPEKLNAINETMFAELRELGNTIGSDTSVRAVVITGAGRGFCAGFDLEDAPGLRELTPTEMLRFQENAAAAVLGIHNLPQPVIAAVNGPAAGGGLSLALACDIRVAGTGAKLAAVFVRGGFSAGDLGCSWFLPRVVGLGVAADLMLTARSVDAHEALRIGLVTQVVEQDELVDTAVAAAERIAGYSPAAVRSSLRALHAGVDAPSLRAHVELENRGQAMLARGDDVAEVLAAAAQGRAPRFAD
jgi:enoyl-CoA hydratase/carnithine racemase